MTRLPSKAPGDPKIPFIESAVMRTPYKHATEAINANITAYIWALGFNMNPPLYYQTHQNYRNQLAFKIPKIKYNFSVPYIFTRC